MKTLTLVLDLVHILLSAAMLLLIPTAWAEAPAEEVSL